MQDRPPRRKDIPDSPPLEPVSDLRRGRQVRIELRGPAGCLAGAIILAVALAILLVAAFAGLIALTVAFWFAAGFAAIAIIAALIRGRFR